jgi:hypothetical protein
VDVTCADAGVDIAAIAIISTATRTDQIVLEGNGMLPLHVTRAGEV